MIRLIAAIDSKRGIANESGIPWSLPKDVKYFRQLIKNNPVLMGRGVYDELAAPFPDSTNYVLSHQDLPVRDGFTLVKDPDSFFEQHSGQVIWVIGGAQIYGQTIARADELYLTKIDKDFSCTKFFPEYQNQFVPFSVSDTMHENNCDFAFEVWKKK